jgi:beta-xylosidase
MATQSTINPIIPGFAPDPSLVLVNNQYYLINSTFHLFPGLPTYTSSDLIHWHQIGNAINRPSQLPLSKSSTLIHPLEEDDHLYATGGLYAPTIRHYNGVFYIVCTNVVNYPREERRESETQNFIISTADIHASEWSDPVYFDFNGIDPSLFFDPSSGKAYLVGSRSPGPSTKIACFQIDVETGEKLSEEKELWHGTGGIYPEGPHIYLHNSYYYLIIAEGGTHEGHAVTMARSKSLSGPWEASPKNPILSAAGTDRYVQCTGHCEVFEDKNGEWWGVCLGIRMGALGLYGLGRETFLVKGKWSEDGWLSFERAELTIHGAGEVREHERLTAAPGVDMLYIRDPDLESYEIEDGVLTLIASPHNLNSRSASPTFIGKRQRRVQGTSSVTLKSIEPGVTAGLAVYKDECRFICMWFSPSCHSIYVQIVNTAKDVHRSETHSLEGQEHKTISFLIHYTESEYTLCYRVDDREEEELCKVDTMVLSDKDFVGPIVGVWATDDELSLSVRNTDKHDGGARGHLKAMFTGFDVDGA